MDSLEFQTARTSNESEDSSQELSRDKCFHLNHKKMPSKWQYIRDEIFLTRFIRKSNIMTAGVWGEEVPIAMIFIMIEDEHISSLCPSFFLHLD